MVFVVLFAFELSGAPVGLVELRHEGATYTYTSRQFFERGAMREQKASFSMYADALPEGLWLWHRPNPGCQPGVEEIGGRRGPLCATEVSDARVAGTMLGEKFEATYSEGELLTLTLGEAKFTRVREGEAVRFSDPFAKGFPISGVGSVLRLASPLPSGEGQGEGSSNSALKPGAPHPNVGSNADRELPSPQPSPEGRGSRWATTLAAEVHAKDKGNCLAHARSFVSAARQRGHSATIIYGLVEDQGRAWPHAWVRADGADLDPTLDVPVTPRTHLALGDGARAAALYLEVLSGQKKVVRGVP